MQKISKTEAEWQSELTPEQYAVTRKKATERAFTGKYVENHEAGLYRCVCCGHPASDTLQKGDTRCGSAHSPSSSPALRRP